MFDVGFSELVLLFVIGLLVLGPQRLPKVAAEIGKWVGRARRTATQLRRQLEREIELADIEGTQKPPPSRPEEPTVATDETAPAPSTPATAPGEADPVVGRKDASDAEPVAVAAESSVDQQDDKPPQT